MDQKRKIDARDILPQFAAMDDQERAAQLMHVLFHRNMSPEVKERFLEWFHSDLNKEAKEKVIQEHTNSLEPNTDPSLKEAEALERLSKLTGMDGGTARAIREKVARRERKMKLRRWTMRAAAVVIPAIAIGGFWIWGSRGTNEATTPVTTVTAADTVRHITLPDGSRVWVNTSSTITYAGDFDKERTVTLDGEAYFSVTEDPGKPFRVKTPDIVVEVLGTEFNVNSRTAATLSEVVLVRGSVEVMTAAGKTYPMTPGYKLTLEAATDHMEMACLYAGEVIPQWKRGDLHLDEVPLLTALQTISDHFGVRVSVDKRLDDDSPVSLIFSEDVTLEYVLGVVKDISGTFDYKVTEDGKVVITANI